MKTSLLLAAFAAVCACFFLLPQAAQITPATQAGNTLRALEAHLLVAPAMAQDHGLLIDRHSAAGLSCQSCHGEAALTEPVAMQVCTDCHGSYAELAAMTPWKPNPHRSHMGEVECSSCHNIHKPSVSFCDECHSFGMQVP